MKTDFILNPLSTAVAVALFATTAISAETPSPITNEQLDTVVVTASRNAMPLERVGSSMTVITQQEIEQRGYTSLADLLRTTTGIATSNSGGPGKNSVIRIRGEEGFRTKILIDGVDTADQSSTQIQSAVEHISLQNIERVEVLRGPQGMMYGADAGGVINIITKKADKAFGADFSTEYGRYDTSNTAANIRGKNDIFDYVISAGNTSTNGFNSRKKDTDLRDSDGYDNTTLDGKLGVNLTEKLRAEMGVRDQNGDFDYDNCSYPTSNDCTSDSRQTDHHVSLAYSGDVFTNKLTLNESNNDRDYYENHIFTGQYGGEMDQVQYLGTWNTGKYGTLIYGADETEDQASVEKQYEPNGNYERDQLGVYTEWQGIIGDHFFYTAGVRNDDNDDFGSHDSYRATAAYVQPIGESELKYKASYGTGFRAPSLYEIAYNDVLGTAPAKGTQLDAEESKGYDAGIEFRMANGFMVEAIYFNQDIDKAIDFDLVNYSGYLQQDGTTESRGVELNTEIPVTDWLALTGNYTYNDTTNPNDDQRIRRPRHYGNIGTRVQIDKWTFLANMGFQNDSEDEIYGTGRVKLDDRQLFDATLSYQATDYLEVYTRAQNIFANDYEDVTGYNVEGAAVYAGLRLKY